jgi:uncharacterized protein YgbK (DUF1537 family)
MIQLGCIADDVTGATDLASTLVLAGFRAVQTIGVPQGPLDGEADAAVVALKSRTIAAADAVSQSLQALRWLQSQGAAQIYFKYCSTFDSTPQGNIGPVTEALMDALGADFSVTTPAFPDNQRTVFKGHLFVGDVLLSDSGMRHHPLTPMTDANLLRVLQAQCRRRVGLLQHGVVTRGADAIRAEISRLRASGVGIAVVDAVCNDDLVRLGPALRGMPLLGAGSGLAIGLRPNFRLATDRSATALPVARGTRAVLAGSCSQATQRQVASFQASGRPSMAIDPQRVAAGEDVVQAALEWARPRLASGPVLLYSTAEPEAVTAIQARLGAKEAGAMVEATLARIAQGLVTLGVGQLVVAGGETSGACVQALGVRQMRIGAAIDPGVPWCHAHAPAAGSGGLHLSLKSGNFGTDDFFTKAFERLAP